MTRIHEEFFTKDRAEAWRKKYLQDFPAITFGTTLKVLCRRGEFWQCVGARFA